MQGADHRRFIAENLLRFLQRRTGRRHERLYFVKRHDGVDDDLAGELAF